MSPTPPPSSSGYDWGKITAIVGSIMGALLGAGKGALMVKGHLEEQRRKQIAEQLREQLTPLLDKALQPIRESQQQIMLAAADDRATSQARHEENIGRFATLETQVGELKERRRWPREGS